MESSLQIRRQLWPFGFRFEYNAAIQLTPVSLSLLADGVLRMLIPPEAFEGGTAVDLKGRDAANFIAEPYGAAPIRDELLYLEGSWAPVIDHQEASDELPFTLRISSVFDSFPSPGHIQHRFEVERTGDVPGIAPALLGYACPIHLKHLRLGIDLFSTFFVTTLAGLTPSVTNTLLLEASDSQLLLRCVREGMKTRKEDPLPSRLMTGLSRTLQRACNVDLLGDIGRLRGA